MNLDYSSLQSEELHAGDLTMLLKQEFNATIENEIR